MVMMVNNTSGFFNFLPLFAKVWWPILKFYSTRLMSDYLFLFVFWLFIGYLESFLIISGHFAFITFRLLSDFHANTVKISILNILKVEELLIRKNTLFPYISLTLAFGSLVTCQRCLWQYFFFEQFGVWSQDTGCKV